MAKNDEMPPPAPEVVYTPITEYTPELLALNVNEQGSNGSMRWNPAYVDLWMAAKDGQPVAAGGQLEVTDSNVIPTEPALPAEPPAQNPPSP